MGKSFSLTFEVPPGNSAYVVPWDSTRGIEDALRTSQAANPAPGQKRGRFDGKIIKYSILCTGQAVTVREQVLVGNAGTNADWQTQGAEPSLTVAAGTPEAREFHPLAPDHRLLIVAGATGPTTLHVRVTLTDSGDYGS